jgi:hypothetical protein
LLQNKFNRFSEIGLQMNQTPPFVLSIARPAAHSEPEEAEKMLIIVRRRYDHLLKELGEAFSGQQGVEILVDRRRGHRRKVEDPVSMERRKADRRKHEEELLKVILPT